MFKIIAFLAVIMTCSATWIAPQPALIIDKPTPYAFGFDTTDEFGTTLTRSESGDGNGAVKGSYSYRDAQGLARVVSYVADGLGFRANVDTNEPGTKTSAPAAVQINANPIAIAPRVIVPRLLAPLPAPVLATKPLLLPQPKWW